LKLSKSKNTMALNLLDSLSSTSATPEKNSFSLKNKEAPDGASADFAQLLGGLMNPSQLKGLAATDGTQDPVLNAEAETGQKVATDSKDPLIPDGAAALLAVTMPAPQNLTALVLSPNMTAITPSQSAPDAGSLVAFAQSQGLDKEVASWLFGAGKGTEASKPFTATPAGAAVQPDTALNTFSEIPPMAAAQSDAAAEPAALDAQALANAAVTISLLATPSQAAVKPLVASTPSDSSPSSIQLMPMATPAAWLTTRAAAPGKTANAAPSLPQAGSEKSAAHTSDLDLSLIFGNGKDPIKAVQTPEVSFTPAAWVMAGVTANAGQTASLLTTSSLVKSLSNDKQADDGSAQLEGVSNVNAERSSGKLSDPLSSSPTAPAKATEPNLSTAERSELHQAQAEKMGQAIGQRMLSEMEKGHWHLKMMLKPANLGNVEVEMRLRNGELDANFTASQAGTRDLLQDGLPKLKDTLTQMGMDVASMNIGGGSSQKNGENSTSQQARSLATAKQTEQAEELVTTTTKPVTPTGQDGLDVMV
jgi:flagellar hook-length control protein FliK